MYSSESRKAAAACFRGRQMSPRVRPCTGCESGENTTGAPGTVYRPGSDDLIVVRCPACRRFPTDAAAQYAYDNYEQVYGCSWTKTQPDDRQPNRRGPSKR